MLCGHFFYYEEVIAIYKKTLKNTTLKKLKQLERGVWVNVVDPTLEEIDRLGAEMGIEGDLITDVLDEYEAPRIEIAGKTIYLFARTPIRTVGLNDVVQINTVPLLFVLANDFLATISKKEIPFLNEFFDGDTDGGEFYTTQKIKLFLQMFANINADYNLFLNAINREIRFNQARIEKIADRDIVATVEQERVLNDFITALVPMNNTLNNILSGKQMKLYDNDKHLTEDLLLSNMQIIDVCKTNIRTIVNIREAYSAILTNSLNQTIKFLTAITIIFTIPTMIASFYGMNVALPLQQDPFAFNWILIGTIFVSTTLFVVFIYRKWL